MTDSRLIISPKTKVGELLDAYPLLESVLIEMSPAFEKLKNPILRRTVARVATLQQVAIVGGLKVDDIVNRLRKEVGQDQGSETTTYAEYLSDKPPGWFNRHNITISFDASSIINSGGSPMNDILRLTSELKTGEIFELQTPFIPAPIIDMLKAKGFSVYSIQEQYVYYTFLTRV